MNISISLFPKYIKTRSVHECTHKHTSKGTNVCQIYLLFMINMAMQVHSDQSKTMEVVHFTNFDKDQPTNHKRTPIYPIQILAAGVQ